MKTRVRSALGGVLLLLGSLAPASAQVSIGIGPPHASIGIHIPVFPQFVRVPEYPVYYAPSLDANYFFYDGMYWVYQGDNWYGSSWYNGPWGYVAPEIVPVYLLRVPVRYYGRPPRYFHRWHADSPPQWGKHWGREWEQRRSGWDRWDRSPTHRPAPLPVYQREYSGDRYPQGDRQGALQSEYYSYRPRNRVVREYDDEQRRQGARPPGTPAKGDSRASERHEQPDQQARPNGHDEHGDGGGPPQNNSGHRSDKQNFS